MPHRLRAWSPLFAVIVLLLVVACGGGEETAQAQSTDQDTAQAGESSSAAKMVDAAEKAAAQASSVDPIQVIAQGQEIDVTKHLVPGRITVVDFYSEYCPPCKRIAPYLEKLHAKGGEVAVLKVDINRPGHKGIDWASPVARQYKLRSIPHFQIYDAEGALLAEGPEAYQKVVGYIQEAGIES
jgi:thiol-disulfide isomerase/thioredoxin